MSPGKIIIETRERFDNSSVEKSVADVVYQLITGLKVDVDDAGWKTADENIKNDINTLDENIKGKITALDEKQKEDVEKLDQKIADILEKKIEEIDKRLGDNQGSLSDEIKNIKRELENLKIRKPLDLIVKLDNSKQQDFGTQHCQLPTL